MTELVPGAAREHRDHGRFVAGRWPAPQPSIESRVREPQSEEILAERLANIASPRQQALLRFVHDIPALNIREIADRLGVQRTAAKHHVAQMRRQSYIVTHRQGRHVLHFVSWTTRAERVALSALRIGSVRSVVAAAFAQPGVSASAVAQRFGMKTGTVQSTLRFLRKTGLVRTEKLDGLRSQAIYLSDVARLTWARWFDASRDRVASLDDRPTRMTLFGLFLFSWLGALHS